MKSVWESELLEQVQRDYKNYRIMDVDLSVARTNEPHIIPGNCLQVIDASSSSAQATIRFNKNTNEAITIKFPHKIKPSVFTSFYISNSAQVGESLTLVVGINFEINNIINQNKGEAQPVIVMTNAQANTNTVGPSQICNRASIQADLDNTGKVFIDFGTPAIQGSCRQLDPGDAITVSLSNINKINLNFEVANEKAFIVYEV